MKFDCLIVDDELEISKTVCEYFNMFDIKSAYSLNYQDGLDFLEKNSVSLLLLDVNLGNESGFLFCKEVRRTMNIPILFISARDTEQDILSGLSLGGDDYITKPFSMNVLLAKVKAILKRSVIRPDNQGAIARNSLLIDKTTMRVYKDDTLLKLKPMEWNLLLYLAENSGRVISKDELLQNVWGDEFVSEGTLSVHVRHLREKIENDPNEPKLIKTVWGTGYLFEEEE